MARVYFEEVQSFRQSPWLLMLISVTCFALTIPFLYGLYWQLIMGEPWGNKPMSNAGLVGTSVSVFVLMGLILWLIYNIKLHTRIDEQGLHFRFFPNQWRWQSIMPREIEKYESKVLGFFKTGGRGFHRNSISKFKAMTIKGNHVIEIKVSNGYLYRLGTQDPASFERAMKKMMNPDN